MLQFLQKKNTDSIHVKEMDNLIGKVNLIDIREPYEYNSGHLPTAKNIPMNRILSGPQEYLDRSQEYYVICQSGARSMRTCGVLKEMGYNVINVSGGTGGYRGPLER